MPIISFALLFAAILLKDALGSLYEFVPDNEIIFEDCPKKPNVLGIRDIMNLTQMIYVYNEGSVSVSGNVTCMWEGVEPTDRFMLHADMYKYQHGDWQPTILSLIVQDYCQIFFDENSVSYQLWTNNIVEEDRLCFNNYGHIYHHRPFTVNTKYEYSINMEGRRKIVVEVTAYDRMNVKREKFLCFQIPGQFYKVK